MIRFQCGDGSQGLPLTAQDFSHAGYRSCTAPLPLERPATATIGPTGANQFAELQAALDAGHIVQLLPGRYILDSDRPLLLARSGSGLRGAGPDRTVIEVHGPRRTAIRIGVEAPGSTVKKGRSSIADDYVPIGATSVRVQSTKIFKVGDQIMCALAALLDACQRLFSKRWLRRS